jgi:hypothetical protein
MSSRARWFSVLVVLLLIVGVAGAGAQTSDLPVKDDPLVRMPGTQPGQVSLESPNRCMNCHAGYNESVEPGFNWQGSMMAQSARDFLYFATVTVAAQDAKWVTGSTNGTDICLRCHFPKGWLEGRSDVTNASLMTGADWDGVQCDFCHRMYDPFFENTYTGNGVSTDWLGYWDEEGPLSQPGADETYAADAAEAATVTLFNGNPFYNSLNQPVGTNYTEATSGQFFIAADAAKRASFADAEARHQMLYSRYHKSEEMCATCHDVSNPILANLAGADPVTGLLPTEADYAGSYMHVERTYSEFALSAYGRGDGAPGIGPFAPDVFATSQPGNEISRCQDCHMRDVSGAGANKNGAVVRPDGSTEHPDSGQPLHDLTGGNVWVSAVLASAVPGSPNYDATNDALLNQGPAVLTLDLNAGQGINPVALLAGADRAAQQLELAASFTDVSYDATTGDLTFRVQNQTGHKLISGFPEGRRMFVNIKGYTGGALVHEVNPYDATASTLKGLSGYTYSGLPAPESLAGNEEYADELVYESHPSSSITGETETFHFALGDGRYKDNRIPPMGFDIDGAVERMSVSVWHGIEEPEYYTAAENAGGYDEVSINVPTGLDSIEIGLYYQTTSREYIEFLRDEINGTATTLWLDEDGLNPAGGTTTYIAQTDPFFDQLRAWGDTIWQLWTHNKDLPGAAPYLMTSATVGGTPPTPAPIPTLLAAEPGQKQVTLTWSDEHTGDPSVIGYNVYYDQADKAQLVAAVGQTISYVDLNLTDGQTYCYKVTSTTGEAESPYSNILCATPDAPGQTVTSGVTSLETGFYETTGKGKNRVTTFVPSTSFAPGDTVIVRAEVFDSNGLPVEGATVDLSITGPESVTLTSGASDAAGIAEASWTTEAPNKKGIGGTAQGGYTVTVTGISGTFPWDGLMTSTGFTLSTAAGAVVAN